MMLLYFKCFLLPDFQNFGVFLSQVICVKGVILVVDFVLYICFITVFLKFCLVIWQVKVFLFLKLSKASYKSKVHICVLKKIFVLFWQNFVGHCSEWKGITSSIRILKLKADVVYPFS